MTIDLSDDRGEFKIQIDDGEVQEIDLLRLDAAAGRRASNFMKEALGHEAMIELISPQAEATYARWRKWLEESEGRTTAQATRFRVTGFSPHDFYDYVSKNAGQVLQFKMHPEHYVSNFENALDGKSIIGEPWGDQMILSYATFGSPDLLRDEGIDMSQVWEEDALYRMAAVGRLPDGTFLCAVMHQILPIDNGFIFKTGSFHPEKADPYVSQGNKEHVMVEFVSMLRVAREAMTSA